MKMRLHPTPLSALLLWMSFFLHLSADAQHLETLHEGWYARRAGDVYQRGEALTSGDLPNLSDWLPATVPGTVLTTLLNNKLVPDPFYGMNNEQIEDIYHAGNDHYTYWFYKNFKTELTKGNRYWLAFRGINYSSEIFLNGHRLNSSPHHGMLLRQRYDITALLQKGDNHLAVIVYPPDPPGNPNGGQGGDGTIARNVTHQYVAGWDWIQPVRDRNTGVWDEVTLEVTGPVDITDTHVITRVDGARIPGDAQAPASVEVTTQLTNASDRTVKGILVFALDHQEIRQEITLDPHTTKASKNASFSMKNPRLWWPNGYGPQALYPLKITFESGHKISDTDTLQVGIRQIQTSWNALTQSRQISVNGQKIFIRGGNWIISDAMLRFSAARYDAEIRMHRDMGLNTIRIWGGAIIERPDFYRACDKYGLLVMQDFGISGDCNGRWFDPKKKEDQWTRRNYPDDKALFLATAADQIRLIRNHPSLAFWCGGNELPPPTSILAPLKDTLARLDGTRWFVPYSTSDEMSFNTIGGNGDGPYGIQNIHTFFSHHTFPFNSEVGSVGLPDIEGLRRYLPDSMLVAPGQYRTKNDTLRTWRDKLHPSWIYHKYLPYGKSIDRYGQVKNTEDFAFKAQLVNYNQYRGLTEGFSSHMWQRYTGFIIWKTQNPWTSMRGQMYDYYLDQNAGLYGLRHANEPVHIYLDPTNYQVLTTNHTFKTQNDLMIAVDAYDMDGHKTMINREIISLVPNATKRWGGIGRSLKRLMEKEGLFIDMRLIDMHQNIVSENFYWLPDSTNQYTGLTGLAATKPTTTAHITPNGKILVTLTNAAQGPVAFFNRISLIDSTTGKRVLPVFYSDNYISVLPGGQKTITMESPAMPKNANDVKVRIQGWNVPAFDVAISE